MPLIITKFHSSGKRITISKEQMEGSWNRRSMSSMIIYKGMEGCRNYFTHVFEKVRKLGLRMTEEEEQKYKNIDTFYWRLVVEEEHAQRVVLLTRDK